MKREKAEHVDESCNEDNPAFFSKPYYKTRWGKELSSFNPAALLSTLKSTDMRFDWVESYETSNDIVAEDSSMAIENIPSIKMKNIK